MQIEQVIPLTVGLLHGIDFFLMTLSSFGGEARKIVFTRFSIKAEYHALVNTIAKFLWLCWLQQDLGVDYSTTSPIHYDNKVL